MSKAVARRAARDYPATVVQELELLEHRLGGRQQIAGLLSLAPLTPDLRYALGMIGDPEHRTKSLAQICAIGNILPGDLMRYLGEAALLRGKVEAAQAIGDGIAAVAKDVMKRAAPYEDACHACRGIGTQTAEPTREVPNPSPEPCDTCLGTGKLEYRPDLDRQKLAIDMAHLLPKGGGINIAQINGSKPEGAGGSGVGAFDALQQVTDRLLQDIGPPEPEEPAEGEVVDGES